MRRCCHDCGRIPNLLSDSEPPFATLESMRAEVPCVSIVDSFRNASAVEWLRRERIFFREQKLFRWLRRCERRSAKCFGRELKERLRNKFHCARSSRVPTRSDVSG